MSEYFPYTDEPAPPAPPEDRWTASGRSPVTSVWMRIASRIWARSSSAGTLR